MDNISIANHSSQPQFIVIRFVILLAVRLDPLHAEIGIARRVVMIPVEFLRCRI